MDWNPGAIAPFTPPRTPQRINSVVVNPSPSNMWARFAAYAIDNGYPQWVYNKIKAYYERTKSVPSFRVFINKLNSERNMAKGKKRTRTGPIQVSRPSGKRFKVTAASVLNKPKGGGKLRSNVSPTSGGKISKGSRKFKKKAVNVYARGGQNRTFEISRNVQDANCVYIGHSTFPRRLIFETAAQQFIKHLAKSVSGEDVPEFTDVIRTFSPADKIIFKYRPDPFNVLITDTDVGANSNIYVVPGGGVTMRNFAQWFLGGSRPWHQNREGTIESVESDVLNNTQFRVDMRKFMLQIYVKTSLKCQNQSVPGTTAPEQDAEVVNNIPLYGKTYDGSGNMLKCHKRTYGPTTGISPIPLVADPNYGLMLMTPSLTPNAESFFEPPQGRDFSNVKRVGKLHVDPGQIKTSSLVQTFRMSMTSLMHLVPAFSDFSVVGGVTQYPTTLANTFINMRERNVGKFRLLAFEKMIGLGTQPVNVSFENNVEVSMKSKLGKTSTTIKQFEKVTLV